MVYPVGGGSFNANDKSIRKHIMTPVVSRKPICIKSQPNAQPEPSAPPTAEPAPEPTPEQTPEPTAEPTASESPEPRASSSSSYPTYYRVSMTLTDPPWTPNLESKASKEFGILEDQIRENVSFKGEMVPCFSEFYLHLSENKFLNVLD